MSLPFVVAEAVWNAQALTATASLKSDFERCQVTVIEVTTAAFSGTIDIQGKLHELSAFANVPYIRQDQASIQTPSVAQIVPSIDTGVYRYVILGYWRKLQIVMTRSAGTITCGVVGSSHARLFPYLPTKLLANSGVDIGDVDVTSIVNTVLAGMTTLPAGSNVIGKVNRKRVPVITPTTGTSAALATLDPAAAFKLLGIRIHLGSALAAAETLTVTLDANAGVAYDAVLFSQDLGTPDIRDIVIPFGNDEDFFVSGDKIVVALSANVGGDTWGCQTIHELV